MDHFARRFLLDAAGRFAPTIDFLENAGTVSEKMGAMVVRS